MGASRGAQGPPGRMPMRAIPPLAACRLHCSRAKHNSPRPMASLAALSCLALCRTPHGAAAAATLPSPRSLNSRWPGFVSFSRAAPSWRWPQAASLVSPGSLRSALATKEPNWFCARDTMLSGPSPSRPAATAAWSSAEQCANAASTTWLAQRCCAWPSGSSRRTATTCRCCASWPCSRSDCMTWCPKEWRQSSAASASSSPTTSARPALPLVCSKRRQRMRQP
mmetsp:Transcript_16713/g.52652  ORF Transcript_16713/g.52652 Transcript_16713/m.52652 type:complete len:224 (+) Transcript_16713:114-785(+)